MYRHVDRLFCVTLLLPVAWAQQFDVSSVKPHPTGSPCGESGTFAGATLLLRCFTLDEMIREALDLQPGHSDELTGGPDWVRIEAWDVTAKAEGMAGELPPSAYRSMLLKLMKAEFALKLTAAHRQIRGFRLVVDHNAKPPPGLMRNSGAPYRFDVKPGISLTARRVSMKEFAAWLRTPMAVGARVVDQTGLSGEYDLTLQWTLDLPRAADSVPQVDAPSLVTALREQLGLKLRPARVLAEVYMIDEAQRPRD